jgi:hypothetical protein
MAMDGLHVHAEAPFLAELISELLSFPVGVHDDQVDALGLAGQLLDKMVPGPKEEKPVPQKPNDYVQGGYTSSNEGGSEAWRL